MALPSELCASSSCGRGGAAVSAGRAQTGAGRTCCRAARERQSAARCGAWRDVRPQRDRSSRRSCGSDCSAAAKCGRRGGQGSRALSAGGGAAGGHLSGLQQQQRAPVPHLTAGQRQRRQHAAGGHDRCQRRAGCRSIQSSRSDSSSGVNNSSSADAQAADAPASHEHSPGGASA